MSRIERLDVRLVETPSKSRAVGTLVESSRRLFFEYGPAFLQNPLWLSPFKLPPQSGLIEHRDRSFGPCFGVFDDSLPDGWGLLLMDRFFRRKGLALESIGVLERLAYLGTRTMGALTYHPPTDPDPASTAILDLQEMARASEEVLKGSSQEVLPQLLRAGGSPGGARPKVLVGIGPEGMISGEDDLPAGYRHWMVKFHTEQDGRDSGAVEQAYALMAAKAGIDMPASKLFETSEGDRFFGVERFDRDGNRRRHVHTFGNLIHSNFRIPSCDYRQLLEVTRILTKDQHQVAECFRRMVFNVLTHNRDDHVKNFAFRLTDLGDWELTPAYDLTYSSGPGGEHSMTVADEGRNPGGYHLKRLAEASGLSAKVTSETIDQVATASSEWGRLASETGVDPKTISRIEKVIHEHTARLQE